VDYRSGNAANWSAP